jgi:nucleoside-diphosphate kinase
MMERTLVLIKPDAMKKDLGERIIKRYTDAGLKVIARKVMQADRSLAEKHYPDTDSQMMGMGNKTLQSAKEAGKPGDVMKIFGTEDPRKIGLQLRKWLVDFITSRPVIALVLEGESAIANVRKITGFTDPSRADKGTIRGDWGSDSIDRANNERRATENLVHASGNPEEAAKEIALWFSPKELGGK